MSWTLKWVENALHCEEWSLDPFRIQWMPSTILSISLNYFQASWFTCIMILFKIPSLRGTNPMPITAMHLRDYKNQRGNASQTLKFMIKLRTEKIHTKTSRFHSIMFSGSIVSTASDAGVFYANQIPFPTNIWRIWWTDGKANLTPIWQPPIHEQSERPSNSLFVWL